MGWEVRDSKPGRGEKILFFKTRQTGSGDHPASLPINV